MKVAFSASATQTVAIKRGDETIEFVVSPLPLGYGDHLLAVLPAPVAPVNGVVTPLKDAEHKARHAMLVLAKALGPVMDATEPSNRDVGAWAKYADAIQAEFLAGHFVEGDLSLLMAAINNLGRGLGDLPKV